MPQNCVLYIQIKCSKPMNLRPCEKTRSDIQTGLAPVYAAAMNELHTCLLLKEITGRLDLKQCFCHVNCG